MHDVEIALCAANLSPDSIIELRFDIIDRFSSRILAVGSRSIASDVVASPVSLSLGSLPVASASRIHLRIAGSKELGQANVRAYEWQRPKFSTQGFSRERRLFGPVISGQTTP